jgi:hypothetical protein
MEINFSQSDMAYEPVDNYVASDAEVPYAPVVDTYHFSSVSVAPESFTVVEYDSLCPMAKMDVVLNVYITDETTGVQSSYKIVKRLGFDKVKLAMEAATVMPLSVVETIDQEHIDAINQAYTDEKVRIYARKVAKLPFAASNNQFEARIKLKDGSSEFILIERARNVGHAAIMIIDDIIPSKFKGASILSITPKI